jgi:hypothetical protein
MKIKAEAASFVKNEGELEKKLEHIFCFIQTQTRMLCDHPHLLTQHSFIGNAWLKSF